MDDTIYCNTLIQQNNILQYFRLTVQYIVILQYIVINCNIMYPEYTVYSDISVQLTYYERTIVPYRLRKSNTGYQ